MFLAFRNPSIIPIFNSLHNEVKTMKRFFTLTLSVLALSTLIATSAKAETRVDRQLVSYSSAMVQPAANQTLLSPFDLAFLAQRGYLKELAAMARWRHHTSLGLSRRKMLCKQQFEPIVCQSPHYKIKAI
jgi:hypothetical protein